MLRLVGRGIQNAKRKYFLTALLRIEAAIVRIMKARKKLSHNLLVTEVSASFLPLKKCEIPSSLIL